MSGRPVAGFLLAVAIGAACLLLDMEGRVMLPPPRRPRRAPEPDPEPDPVEPSGFALTLAAAGAPPPPPASLVKLWQEIQRQMRAHS